MHAPSSSSKHKISTIRAFPRCPCVIFVSEYKMLKFQRHPETHALVTHFGHSAPFRSPYFYMYKHKRNLAYLTVAPHSDELAPPLGRSFRGGMAGEC